MPRPLQHSDPPTLGPFSLRGRLYERAAGVVYLGHDAMGREVSVAVLTRGAAGDAAARDRFRAAVAGPGGAAARGAAVVAADVDGLAPWVATVWDGRQAGAERFLQAVEMVGPGSVEEQDVRGPQFQPYWAGADDPAVPPVGPAYPSGAAPVRSGRAGLWLALGGGVLALCLLAALGAFLLLRSPDDPDPVRAAASAAPSTAPSAGPTPDPSSPPQGGPPGGASPRPSAPAGAGPTSEPGSNAGAGSVVGARYGRGDDTYTMRLEGLGFTFRTPRSWSCLRSSKAAARWICIDEHYKGRGRAPGGIVQVAPCRSSCGPDARREFVMRVAGSAESAKGLRSADPQTEYAVGTFKDGGMTRYVIVMVHAWHKGGATRLNSMVLASFDGPLGAKSDLQKIVNDIHANTP